MVTGRWKTTSRFLLLNAGLAFCYKSPIFPVVLGCSNNPTDARQAADTERAPSRAGGARSVGYLPGVVLKGGTSRKKDWILHNE